MWQLWAIGYGLCVTPLLIFQRSLFPWSRALPALKWIFIVGMPAIGGVVLAGLVSLANGALDMASSVEREYVVTKRFEEKEYELRPTSGGAMGPTARIHTREPAIVGDRVLVVSKPGALGFEWLVDYRAVK